MKKKKQISIQNARFMKPTVSSEFKSGSKYQQENKPPIAIKQSINAAGKTNRKFSKYPKKKIHIEIPQLTQLNELNEKNGNESPKAISDRTLTPKVRCENSASNLDDSNQKNDSKRNENNHNNISQNELLEVKSKSSSSEDLNVNATGINSREIEQAQETCKQLRDQIFQLKQQQKEFLKQTLPPQEVSSNNDHGDLNSTINAIKSANTLYRSIRYQPLRALLKSPVPNSLSPITTKAVKSNIYPVKSESNISVPESDMSSLDTSVKSDCLNTQENGNSRKLIKKLYCEKVKYKSKVQELKNTISKYEKNACHMRTPDIPAHQIAYYNADLIGEGRMSLVYSGTIYETMKAAVKKLVRPDTFSSSDRSYLVAEAGLLISLRHQNIVEVFGVSSSPLQPLLIMELVNGVTLQDKIYSNSHLNGLNIAEYYSVARDVCIGMAYLHNQKPPALHLNLRPCNIFIASSGKAKVADFGFSKIRQDAGASNRDSIPYLAPELLHFPVHLTTKLDVFSYAIILWEMATQIVPFHQLSLSQILEYITEGKRLTIPSSLPSGFHSLIMQCWNQSPLQRPTFKEIIVVIEAMILPTDWKQEIEKKGLKKLDAENLFGSEVGKKKYTPISSYQPIVGKDDRQRVADDMTLEHDMKTFGYQSNHQGELFHGRSNAYNSIEKSMRKYDQYRKPTHRHDNSCSQVPPQSSPLKISLNKMSEVYGIEKPNVPDIHAAPTWNENVYDLPQDHQFHNSYDGSPFNSGAPQEEEYLSARMTESIHKANESGRSTNDEDEVTPLPLTNRDLRYIDQDLNVETPKIIYQAKPYAQTESATSMHSENSVKGVLSSNMENPTKRNCRSKFDVKMKSYLSDACESESRAVTDVRVPNIGWKSSRSNILHRKPPTQSSSSDKLKVMSIGTSEADKCFKYPQHRSDTLTESVAESRLSTAFQPTQQQRQQLHDEINQSNRLLAEQEAISTTLSLTSFPEDRQIAVLSHFSNTDNGKTSHADVNSSSSSCLSSPSTVRNQSNGKQTPERKKKSKRRNSKLERSYTPDHQASSSVRSSSGHSIVKNQYSNSWNPVPLPPRLSNNNNHSVVKRSFSNGSLASHSGSNLRKSSSNRDLQENDRRGMVNGTTRTIEPTNSCTSFQTNDSVTVELTETAKELTDISELLKTVAKQRKHKK